MYCHHCGKEVGEIDAFCPYCGANLKNAAPKIQRPAQAAEPPKANAPSDERANPPMSVLSPIGFSLPFVAVMLLIVACIFFNAESFSSLALLTVLGSLSAVAGLILSIVGIVRGNKLGGNQTGKRLAISGIVLNAVVLFFAAYLLILFFVLGFFLLIFQ